MYYNFVESLDLGKKEPHLEHNGAHFICIHLITAMYVRQLSESKVFFYVLNLELVCVSFRFWLFNANPCSCDRIMQQQEKKGGGGFRWPSVKLPIPDPNIDNFRASKSEFYAVQKRRSPNFEALALWNFPSGSSWKDRLKTCTIIGWMLNNIYAAGKYWSLNIMV